MVTARSIDMAAVGRISKRVDLRDIRLAELSMSSLQRGDVTRPLEPIFDHDCLPVRVEDGYIEVACSYNFRVRSADVEVATAIVKYVILYKLLGDEPTDEKDVAQFAYANGSYHSWPFFREIVYGLTAKMGFQPYTLPVLIFGQPKPVKPPEPPPATTTDEAAAPGQPTD